MDSLKRKAASRWGANPNEGMSRPRPVKIMIPLIDENEEHFDISEIINYINNLISLSPHYYKDISRLQKHVTTHGVILQMDNSLHISFKRYLLNKLINILNGSKLLYKSYVDIDYWIDRVDKISFRGNKQYIDDSDSDSEEEDEDKEEENTADKRKRFKGSTGGLRPEFHYNIQIHLPESRDQAVYDAIFKSLKKHLF